jgi:hypothetical protein
MSETNEPAEQSETSPTQKLGARAMSLGAKLAAAAQPAKERATEIAQTAAAASAPKAAQMKERAAEIAERAAEVGAKGAAVVGGSVDRATGGKYSSRISGITSKIQKKLDPDEQTATTPPSTPPPASTGPAPTEAAAPATGTVAPEFAADDAEPPLR